MVVPQFILVPYDVDKHGHFNNLRAFWGFANLGRFDLGTFYCKFLMTGLYANSFLNWFLVVV